MSFIAAQFDFTDAKAFNEGLAAALDRLLAICPPAKNAKPLQTTDKPLQATDVGDSAAN